MTGGAVTGTGRSRRFRKLLDVSGRPVVCFQLDLVGMVYQARKSARPRRIQKAKLFERQGSMEPRPGCVGCC